MSQVFSVPPSEQVSQQNNANKRGQAQPPLWRAKTKVFDDPCSVQVHERQSQDTGVYQTNNFFRKCGEPVHTPYTLDQVQTNAQVWGWDQCNADGDSKMRYSELTNLRNVQQLYARPYSSQGYRGAGANSMSGSDQESDLLQGQSTTNFKACEPTSEVNIDRFAYLPGHPQMSPVTLEHTIEPFTRAGIDTRDLVRRMNYGDYCNSIGKKGQL